MNTQQYYPLYALVPFNISHWMNLDLLFAPWLLSRLRALGV